MRVGYVRVSTVGQNTARQEVLMEELGAERVYIDRMSGKNTSRPALRQMLEFVREGDLVVVESISRFARNTRDLLELVEQLSAKGGGVRFQEGGHRYDDTVGQVHADDLRCCGRAGA